MNALKIKHFLFNWDSEIQQSLFSVQSKKYFQTIVNQQVFI